MPYADVIVIATYSGLDGGWAREWRDTWYSSSPSFRLLRALQFFVEAPGKQVEPKLCLRLRITRHPSSMQMRGVWSRACSEIILLWSR